MARESTQALMSGFVFSALAFHHVSSASDSEGFLCGDVKGEAKDCITDSQMSDVEVVYTIDIQRHIPCHRPFSFYSSLGEVNKTAIQKLLSGQEKDVIGWYKFRDNTSQTMTLREKLLHENLQTCLSNTGLVFLLVTSQCTTETKSTHRMEYALHKPQDSDYPKIPLIISNLGMSEQQGYKASSGACVSLGFNQAVKKHRLEFFQKDGNLKEVNKITAMCTSLQEELKETCSRVLESEYSVEKLLQQVNQLKKQIAEKKLPKDDEMKSAAPEENIFLRQALHHFFPHSPKLQSCHLTLDGSLVPNDCNNYHNITEMDKLTLMIEECDLPEVCFRKSSKRKRVPHKRKDNSVLPRTRASMRVANHNDDRLLLNSGTETEDDSQHFKMDYSGPHSPTF